MKKKLNIMLVILIFLILIGLIVKFHFDILSNTKAMASLLNARDQALKNLELSKNEGSKLQKTLKQSDGMLKKLDDTLDKLEQEAKQGSDVIKEQEMEDELDQWFGAIDKLKNYIKNNPEYAIPEFKYLSNKDWLRMTQGKMETEADYRKALASLRLQALIDTNRILNQAISDFRNAHNGSLPQSYENIQQYLPEDFDIARYAEVQPGENPSGATNSKLQWIIKDVGPVDPIWDSGLWMAANGATRIPPINYQPEIMVRDAINEYEKENGNQPTNSSQIKQYINTEKINEADIDEIYESVMTPVQ